MMLLGNVSMSKLLLQIDGSPIFLQKKKLISAVELAISRLCWLYRTSFDRRIAELTGTAEMRLVAMMIGISIFGSS